MENKLSAERTGKFAEYFREYFEFVDKTKIQRIHGLAKEHLVEIFNTSYFNREFYVPGKPLGLFHLDVEDNRQPYRRIFQEVLEFCYYNDVFKQTGLSVVDIMDEFDYASFSYLRDFIVKENNLKVKHMSDIQAQIDDKQKKIAKGN
ncbi:MAG: hypothetical protein VZR64_08020 [Eubacterium sp.]|nr:hypothetical protein [Eubacterium sp.]